MYHLPILIILLLLSSACRTDSSLNHFTSFESTLKGTAVGKELYNFYNQPNNGELFIEFSTSFYNRSNTNVSFYMKHDYTQMNPEFCQLNDSDFRNVEMRDGYYYLYDEFPENESPFNASEIKFQSKNYNGTIKAQNEIKGHLDNFISTGKNITWNRDTNNFRGVVLLIHFNPGLQFSDSLMQLDFVSKGLWMEDTGEYILEQDLLEEFPVNSLLRLDLIRGSYQMISSNDKKSKMRVICKSSSHGYFPYRDTVD